VLTTYNSSKEALEQEKQIARKKEEIDHAKTKSAMVAIIHKAK
jgi:hypothetical protein